MAITAADVSVATNGDIRWEDGGAGDGPYTVLELHRYLQSLADDQQASGDDLLDITSPTPSERSTDNIITLNGTYNIDAEMAQHLYDGSITQGSGDEVYSGLVVVGAVNLSTTLMIVQDNALYDDGVHTPSSPFWGTGLNSDATANILMRCMILTRSGGTDVDGKKIRVQAREYLDTYAEFSVTLGLGNSTAAIFTSDDLNNTTAAGTVATWDTIVNNTEGYVAIDLGGGDGDKYYYSEWDRAAYTINQLYERAKWLQRRGATSDSSGDLEDLYGMDGELFRGITHQIAVDNPGGTFDAFEPVSWSGGTGYMLAINSPGAATAMWIQLTSGAIVTEDQEITGTNSSATCDADATITSRLLSPCFLGQSTGTAIIGGYGVGIESADLTSSDLLFDLANASQQPPNNVTFTVSGLVAGEDYVLVTNDESTDIDYDQLTLDTDLTASGQVAIVCSGAIPVDTPAAGTVRVNLDSGIYRRVAYTSYSGVTFTTASTDWTDPLDAQGAKNIFISYIDKLAGATSEEFTTIYNAPRTLFIRVRDGGGSPIKTYETTGTLGTAGGSATATRTPDA